MLPSTLYQSVVDTTQQPTDEQMSFPRVFIGAFARMPFKFESHGVLNYCHRQSGSIMNIAYEEGRGEGVGYGEEGVLRASSLVVFFSCCTIPLPNDLAYLTYSHILFLG